MVADGCTRESSLRDLPFDPRMIGRELPALAVTHQVEARVPDMADQRLSGARVQQRQRRAETAVLGARERVLEQRCIRRGERLGQTDRMRRPILEPREHPRCRVQRHAAGHVAGRMPAHSVGDREEAVLRGRQERIFIAATAQPDMAAGAAEQLKRRVAGGFNRHADCQRQGETCAFDRSSFPYSWSARLPRASRPATRRLPAMLRRRRPRTHVSTTDRLDPVYTPVMRIDAAFADHFQPTMVTDAAGELDPALADDLLATRYEPVS